MTKSISVKCVSIGDEEHFRGLTIKEEMAHSFGDNTIWENGPWRIICKSWTKTRERRYCDSYSYIEVEVANINKKIFGGKFRDGKSALKDKPGCHVKGFGIIRVTDNGLLLVVYMWEEGPRYYKLLIS